MNLDLQHSYALLTGGSKGIGYAIAEGLAREGVNLILVARTLNDLLQTQTQLQSKYGVSVEVIAADLSDSLVISQLVEKAAHVDILINNAGSIPPGDLESVDENTWRNAWNLKVFGYINMTRAFYQVMKDREKKVLLSISPAYPESS